MPAVRSSRPSTLRLPTGMIITDYGRKPVRCRALRSAHCPAPKVGAIAEAGRYRRGVTSNLACVGLAGFEATVCLPADDRTTPPRPGSVIAGMVFLTASLPGLALPRDKP